MKKFFIIGSIVFLLTGGYYFFKTDKQASGKAAALFINYASDVIGTKVGTTTTMVGFYTDMTASSSYINKIGGKTDMATYTFAAQASSTPSGQVAVSFWGSYDDGCETASSTTSFDDIVLTGDVNWFMLNSYQLGISTTHLATLPVSTTTLNWFPAGNVPLNKQNIVLKDLNYECLKMNLSASSTKLWTQLKIE